MKKEETMRKEIMMMKKRIARLEGDKIEKPDYRFFFFFLLLTPVHIIGYVLFAIVRAIVKPFEFLRLTNEQKEYYKIGGDFNEFEYMWASITQRKKN